MFRFKKLFRKSSVHQAKSIQNQFSGAQMEQIRLGREAGLSERQIRFYAKPEIDCMEMWDLREQLNFILDVPFLIEKYRPDLSLVGQTRYLGWIATMGGICGDIAGSRYEFYDGDRSKISFETAISTHSSMTDDSILMLATLEAVRKTETDSELRQLMAEHEHNFTEEFLPFGDTAYSKTYREFYKRYPAAGYGGGFVHWALEGKGPYKSFGNGSAMRVAPIGEAFESVEDVILHAIASAACTHNHPEGIKGAVVTAVCIWMARHGCTKDEMLTYVKTHYGNQDLIKKYTMKEVSSCKQGGYAVSCQFTVPAAVTCFVESSSYEECISNALSFEGDSDTIAAISGAIAAAYYGDVSDHVRRILREKLSEPLLEFLFPLGKGE